MGASAFGRPGFSSTTSTAKLNVATPASARRSVTPGAGAGHWSEHTPESLLGRVVNNLMGEIGPQERLAAHHCEDPASRRVEPADGTARHLLRHSFYAVVEGPAVMAIQIAFPCSEQVGNDRMEIPRQDTRLDVREQPAAHIPQDVRSRPTPCVRIVRRAVDVGG